MSQLVHTLDAMLIHATLQLGQRTGTGHRESPSPVIDDNCRGTLLVDEHAVPLSLLIVDAVEEGESPSVL